MNSMVQVGCQNGNLVNIREYGTSMAPVWHHYGTTMAPVCEGTSSHFALGQSLVIYVIWPRVLLTLCNKFGQNSCMLVASQPFEVLRRSAFSNVAPTGIWPCDTTLKI